MKTRSSPISNWTTCFRTACSTPPPSSMASRSRNATTFPSITPTSASSDLDENALKPYFELDNVLQNGVLYAATQLYGITFKERHDIPVYHPDVRVFRSG